jgi:peptidoglycan/xylan/chitin deacetylase (PgdA/CDA1 family)
MPGLKSPPVPVLMMHGVCDPVPEYASMPDGRTCLLGVEDFDRLLEWCRKDFDILRLGELNELLASGNSAKYRPIILTFDDGLASTLDHAVPLLKRHGLSATMFVTTDWIDSGVTPPIFELERVLSSEAPTRIELSVGEHSFRWNVENTAEIGGVLANLWTFLFERRIAPLEIQIDDLMVGGQPFRAAERPDRDFWFPATWGDLRDAVVAGTLEIGSHMKSHTPLTWIDRDGVEEEMARSKNRLENEFGLEVQACSYPHGMSNPLVCESACKFYAWGFSNLGGLLRRGTPRHLAPRFHVPGERWDAVKNRIRLARWDAFDVRSRLARSAAIFGAGSRTGVKPS